MNISGTSHTLAAKSGHFTGNTLHIEKGQSFKTSLAEQPFRHTDDSNISKTSANRHSSSSLAELETYFEEKIALLKKSGKETSSITDLRDTVREAATNKSADAPPLPKVEKHPYGGKVLTNVHLSFGSKIDAEPVDLKQQLEMQKASSLMHLKLLSSQ